MSLSDQEVETLKGVFEKIKKNPMLLASPKLAFVTDFLKNMGVKLPGAPPADDGHGHSHAGGNHGHSHAGGNHGHSHGGDDNHGHSHGGDNHGHSHDHGSHGHSHGPGGHDHDHDDDEDLDDMPDLMQDEGEDLSDLPFVYQSEEDEPEPETAEEEEKEDIMQPDSVNETELPLPVSAEEAASREPSDSDLEEASKVKEEADIALGEGNFEKALQLLTKAIALTPTAQTVAKRAQVLIQLKRPNAAIRDCDFALKLNANSARAHKFRGKAHQMLGKWVESVHSYQAANAIDYDDNTYEVLKQIKPKADKIEHRERAKVLKAEKRKERRREAEKKWREENERRRRKREEQKRQSGSSGGGNPFGGMGGMPGGMGGNPFGGMGGMPGGMGGMGGNPFGGMGGMGGMGGGMPGGMGGMGGGMPGGMGGMPGGMGGMPGMEKLFSDPGLMAAMQDPEILEALQNPTGPAAQKPSVKAKLEKLTQSFMAGRGGGAPKF